jgi:phage portal protein BeeE
MITLQEQLKEVDREIGMRQAVYARRVESGKMTSQEAKHKIEIMKAVKETISKAMRSQGDARN